MKLFILNAICRLMWSYSTPVSSTTQTVFPTETWKDGLPSYLPDDLNRLISFLMEVNHVPGLSLAIVNEDKITTKGYEYARLPSTLATPDILYLTGSTTKAFTAAAAGIMVGDDKQYPDLDWTSRLHDHLPEEFVLNDDYATTHVTLEDALSHRTGLPDYDYAYGWGNKSLFDTMKVVRHLPQTAELRTVFQYCNVMFMIVSRFLEVMSGQSLFDLIRQLVWQPVGMRSTFFFPDEFKTQNQSDIKTRLARGYFWVDNVAAGERGAHYVPEPYMNLSLISGAGATVSSVNDFALWARTLLHADIHANPGSSNQSSPIDDITYAQLVLPRIPILVEHTLGLSPNDFRRPDSYALGWLTTDFLGSPLITHNGGLNGFSSDIWLIPDHQIGIVVMANTVVSFPVASAIASTIFNAKILGKDSFKDHEKTPTKKHHELVRSFRKGSRNDDVVQCDQQARSFGNLDAANAFVGTFYHPSFGELEITPAYASACTRFLNEQNKNKKSETREVPDLHVQPEPRTWLFDYYLRHEAESWFQATRWEPHGNHTPDTVPGLYLGCQGPACEIETVFESEETPSFVRFEFDPRPMDQGIGFQKAARFGIHLTHARDREAEGYGKAGSWSTGVFWFERTS